MEALPNELLYRSFSFLAVQDLKALRLVNRFFSDICVTPLFSGSGLHVVLTRESTERLIDASRHARICPLITSLLYEANPLDRFDEHEWVAHIKDGDHPSLDSQPRNPNRIVSLLDQRQYVRGNVSTAKTRNAMRSGWASYLTMREWQQEALIDKKKHRAIYQAIERFPNLKTIQIYIGPFTSYGQRSFAPTFLPHAGRRRIEAWNLFPPGVPSLFREVNPMVPTAETAKRIQSCIKVMYLDEINVMSIADLGGRLLPQTYTPLHWLQDLRIAFESGDMPIWMPQPLKNRIIRFLRHTPNLRKLDIGWSNHGRSRIHDETTEIFSILGQITWEHLHTIMIRDWRMTTALFLDFCREHKNTLRNINLDCVTLICDDLNPWASCLASLRHLKRWEKVEIWGVLWDFQGNRYIMGWPPETAWVKDGASSCWMYVNNPRYFEHTKAAREQIEQYVQGQTDLNPFSDGGAADACAIWKAYLNISSEFADFVIP